jgi:tRNA 2-thiocytidine biosynthesis protein TtcA
MIQNGDHVAVGVSGGKDSLTLLWMLSERQSRVPINFDIFAIYVDPGFKESFAESLKSYCSTLDINLIVKYSDCGIVAHGPENRENPCFLCSRLRRKLLFETADALGCQKIALGHNKDDVIETLFLNICYGGEISTMLPHQTLFKDHFAIIRPLAFCDEVSIQKFVIETEIPIFDNPCPSAKASKRREIKKLLNQLYRSNQKIRGNIFRAMHNVRKEYLP